MTRNWSTPLLLALLACPSWAAGATAQDSVIVQPRRISLQEALRLYVETNLELRLARESVAAAEAREVSAGMFSDPSLSATREQLSLEGETYHETAFTLGQTLEIGGQRGLRRQAAEEVVSAAIARLETERQRLGFQVHRAYVRAAAAEANLGILREATVVVRRVQESGQTRFVEGDISRFDRNRLQIERVRYETLLARAALELDEAARELTVLVAPASLSEAVLLPADPLAEIDAAERALELDAALATAADRADVRAAAAEVAAARATLSLARRERVPDLTLSGGYKRQADGFNGAVVGLSLPLPLWNRNQGGVAEAQAALDAAMVRHALAMRGAESEIRRAWEVRRSLRERTRTFAESLLPGSGGILEIAQLAYAEGEMSLVELLDAADAYRSGREIVNELLADYLIAIYDLERATGRLMAPAANANTEPAQ